MGAHNYRSSGRLQSQESEKTNLTQLKLLYTNARSIVAKISELSAVSFENNPDVIAITESWTNPNIDSSFLQIAGYNLLIRKDREDTTDGRGGGILVYIKNELKCYEIPSPSTAIQIASFKITLDKDDLDMYIVYRSPNSSQENNSRINDVISSVEKNSIIVGDFNYPMIDWNLLTGNPQEREFLGCVV